MDQKKSKLHWENPLLDPEFVADLITIISPYATSSAIRELFQRVPPPVGLQVLTSWTSDSLLGGSADPEVFRVIEEYGGRLYLHDRIHLKLYVCSSHHAVLSTGNLTRSGLGFSSHPNIEASAVVELQPTDWDRISQLFSKSRRVTTEIYEKAVEFCETHRQKQEPAPRFTLPDEVATVEQFSWLSLPASKHPEELWRDYSGATPSATPEQEARMQHDLQIYDIQDGLGEESFHAVMSTAFLRHPFIKELGSWIKEEGHVGFGKVKAWLQRNCSDKPTPYRWELTPATQALYEWLAFYHESITWSRPNHSQVMKWSDS